MLDSSFEKHQNDRGNPPIPLSSTTVTPPPLSLDEALARGEVLAANTTEATHVIRVGGWVYKFLKPSDQFPPKTAAESRRQIELRVRESWVQPELNPLRYDGNRNVLLAKYVAGRPATISESSALYRHFRRTCRGYLIDITAGNVIVVGQRFVLIDFILAEDHFDWHASHALVDASVPTET